MLSDHLIARVVCFIKLSTTIYLCLCYNILVRYYKLAYALYSPSTRKRGEDIGTQIKWLKKECSIGL